MNTSTDSIERKIVLKAPRSRVWRALANAREFGDWFGVNLKGKSFAAGKRVQGQVTHPGYEHVVFDIWIERVEPERVFSWRWHPAALEPGVDYSKEPTTLVVFELTDVEGGTLLWSSNRVSTRFRPSAGSVYSGRTIRVGTSR